MYVVSFFLELRNLQLILVSEQARSDFSQDHRKKSLDIFDQVKLPSSRSYMSFSVDTACFSFSRVIIDYSV